MTGTHAVQRDVCDKSFPDNQSVYRALNDSQFIPFFQPIVTLRTGQLAGFEVLARWRHPTKGMIPPNDFIPLAERDGWIGELTRQLLKKALKAAAEVPGTFTVSFNLSPLQLRDLGLPEQIRQIALEANFSPTRLVAEITESALIDDTQQSVIVVAELKAMGCKLALDDFGTGYSSLRHLHAVPFDELKVDRSFVSSMTDKRESRKIVSAVVGLGQSLGLTNVAEGIETEEQAEMLTWLGCELGQGYFFGRPMPLEELAGYVSTSRDSNKSDGKHVFKGISRRNLELSPSQRLAELEAVYDGAPVGLAFLDKSLRFVNLNKKLADINGSSVESHLGNHISLMRPDMFPHLEPYLNRALGGEATLDMEVTNPDTGEIRRINYQPALDEAGEIVGIAIAVSILSEAEQVENAFKAGESSYTLATEGPSEFSRSMNPISRELQVAEPSILLAEKTPLRWYEAHALNLIAQHKLPDGLALDELAREMHKVGLVQATSLAVNSLRRKKFALLRSSPVGIPGNDANVTRILITPYGQHWLDTNPRPVLESTSLIPPSTEVPSLIDLLSTLQFRR